MYKGDGKNCKTFPHILDEPSKPRNFPPLKLLLFTVYECDKSQLWKQDFVVFNYKLGNSANLTCMNPRTNFLTSIGIYYVPIFASWNQDIQEYFYLASQVVIKIMAITEMITICFAQYL